MLGAVVHAWEKSSTQKRWENEKLEPTKGFLKRKERKKGKAAMSAVHRHAEGTRSGLRSPSLFLASGSRVHPHPAVPEARPNVGPDVGPEGTLLSLHTTC